MDELQSFMTGEFSQIFRTQCIGFKSFFSLILGIVDAGIGSAIDDVGDVGIRMKKFFNICKRADIDISMPCRDEGDMLLFAQFLERSTYEALSSRDPNFHLIASSNEGASRSRVETIGALTGQSILKES